MPEFIANTQGAITFPNGPHYWHNVPEFQQGYIEAMLFTWCEEEQTPSFADIAPETLIGINSDCEQFQKDNETLLEQAYTLEKLDYDATQAGRDFWFTRCGHGVGFWDRGLGEIGDNLSNAANAMGDVDAYYGDDGRVYLA